MNKAATIKLANSVREAGQKTKTILDAEFLFTA